MIPRNNKKKEAPAVTRGPAGGGPRFPVVGIGASAGGLRAFEAFFSGIPAGKATGMAFVLIQHLPPDHKSILAELIGRYTSMQVLEVRDGMKLKPDCVYIIPPNRNMTFADGALRLFEPAAREGRRLPIDMFFRSLAQDRGELAIGIVLSGTGADGTLGVRAIKGEGGLVLAQPPATAEYDGMPRSAIATGMVDFILEPADMPAQLLNYTARAFRAGPAAARPEGPEEADLMKTLFALLRVRSGNDFSCYKRNTVARRIKRRMAIRNIDALGAYVKYLQKNPPELDALFSDLLIGVTRFFRDQKEFKALEQAIAGRLSGGKTEGRVIRAWVPACSTGEEAYSLAILLSERIEALGPGVTAQIFATDIDSQAIATARAGVYPAGISGDITPQRLSRFFTAEPGGTAYRVNKSVRDMMVFSEQNVLRDPPFSRLDIVSCRNLLIYLGAELQEKLAHLFHYVLNPDGLLFLGTAENLGGCDDLFTALSHRNRIFRRKEPAESARRKAVSWVAAANKGAHAAQPAAIFSRARRPALRELAERALLQQRGLAAALTDERGEILYLHGRSGRYLEPAPGDVGMNILKMAREGLRAPLAAALKAAAATMEPARHPDLRVKTNGDFTWVNLVVRQIKDAPEPGQKLFLVTLEPVPEPAGAPAGGPGAAEAADLDGRAAALQEELRLKEESLKAANAELANFNEELMSANEELQSSNEELQSTNEELSTSTEELQSVNEELSTVNAEQRMEMDKLARANDDIQNLMAGSGIITVFVDNELRIKRFTPSVTRVLNLIASDEGRPLAHIVSNLAGYSSLVEDTRALLDTLVPRDIEVQAKSGDWYLLRIRPYHTTENVIAGAAITFLEISELRRVQETARRLAVVLRDARDAVTVQGLDGSILAWNPAAERTYGWSEAEALTMNIRDLVPEPRREAALGVAKKIGRGEFVKPFHSQRLCKDGHTVKVWVTATALQNNEGAAYAIATTERQLEMD